MKIISVLDLDSYQISKTNDGSAFSFIIWLYQSKTVEIFDINDFIHRSYKKKCQ